MRSALYRGEVVHSRTRPVGHRLRRPIVMPLLFLDEVDRLRLRPLFSTRRAAPMRFRRRDYLGEPGDDLAGAVRAEVRRELGFTPGGPVALLAAVRTWGWLFNPLAIYYCFGSDGERIEAVVLEVTNTPWGDRVGYVLDGRSGALTGRFEKRMHVSPFLPMGMTYDIRLGVPGERCTVSITVSRGDTVMLRAAMRLERRALSRATLAWTMVRHPLMTHRISLGIYREALALWRKGVPFLAHPDRRVGAEPAPHRP